MSKDPLFGFQGDKLKSYLERNKLAEKQTMLVYSGLAMTHEYNLAEVVIPEHGKQKRIVARIKSTGEEVTFYRNGNSVTKKTGHYKLLPLVPWVITRLGYQSTVRFNWKWGYA